MGMIVKSFLSELNKTVIYFITAQMFLGV